MLETILARLKKIDIKTLDIKTVIGIILVLVGVSLASFPYIQNYYYQRIQQQQADEQLGQLAYGNDQLTDNEQLDEYLEERSKQSNSLEEVPTFMNDHDIEEDRYPKELEPAEGLLEIPAIDLQLKIGYGVDLPDLEDGPGFYPESEYPDIGNVSIAGHRTTYGAPFRHLNELEQGDLIKLYYQGTQYTYEVDEVFDTHKWDWSVVDPTSSPALTLTTCHPPGSAEKRLILRAYLTDSTDDWD